MAQIQKGKGLKKVPKNQIKDSSGVKGAGQVTDSSSGGAPSSNYNNSRSQPSTGYTPAAPVSRGPTNQGGDIRAQLANMFGGGPAPSRNNNNNTPRHAPVQKVSKIYRFIKIC